jgi:hypothetical protein
MQTGVGCNTKWRTRMVDMTKALRLLILAFIFASPTLAWCDEHLIQRLPADQIENGCNLYLYALETESPALGRPDHSLDLRWACKDGQAEIIDTYEIEGGSPSVVTILYRKNRDIVVLVKWESNSQAADIIGDYYKIYVYRHTPENFSKRFYSDKETMKKLGEGWEGVMNGRRVHFPYKDAASIRKALDRLKH